MARARDGGFLMRREWLASAKSVLDPWAGLAIFTVVAMLVRGYGYGREDQNLYLPFVLKWNSPSLFPHDYLLAMTFARESVVWRGLALLARVIPLAPLLLALMAASTYGVLLLVHKMALRWWKDRWAAWLAVALWVPAYVVPGVAINTSDDYFTMRVLGTLCGVAALYWFFEEEDGKTALALFLGGMFHILSAIPFAFGIAFSGLVERRWKRVAGASAALLSSALVVGLTGVSGGRHSLFVRYGGPWFDIVRRADVEIFPQYWMTSSWVALALLVALFLCLMALSKSAGLERAVSRRTMHLFVAQVILSCIGGAGAAFHLAVLAQLCLLRGWLTVMLLGNLLLAGCVAWLAWRPRAGQTGNAAKILGWSGRAAVAMAVAVLWLGTPLARAQEKEYSTGELGAMELVKSLVPMDGTVIVPPDWMDFRLRTLRSPFVTYKDRAPALYDEAYAREWMRRIEAVRGFENDAWKPDPGLRLTAKEVVAIRRNFERAQVRHIVTMRKYNFRVLGRAGRYALYEIPEEPPAGPEGLPVRRGAPLAGPAAPSTGH
jgi:hypothetical protein